MPTDRELPPGWSWVGSATGIQAVRSDGFRVEFGGDISTHRGVWRAFNPDGTLYGAWREYGPIVADIDEGHPLQASR